MNDYARLVVDWFYPPKCMICRQLLPSSHVMICPSCRISELPEFTGPQRTVQNLDGFAAAFYYKEPIRDAILRFKFHGMQEYAVQFAAWMANVIRGQWGEDAFDLVTWVPCSWQRKWARGFDQTYLLAKALGEELGLEAVRTLKKVRHNRKQSGTKDAARRRANVMGVYRPWQPENFAGKRVLLVDDVLTTGATMAECGKTLRIAGVGKLYGAAVAAASGEHKK